MVDEQLKIEYVPIEILKPNSYNPKQITEKEAIDLEKSIIEFGIVDPLIVNKAKEREGIIIGGHQRFQIYQKLKFKEVPVVWLDIPDFKKEQELCLRLSKNTGEWDIDMLLKFDQDMLMNVGFDNDELGDYWDSLLSIEDDNFNVQKELAEIKEVKTQKGDFYKLGNHRLICGDSTDLETVKKLVGEEKINMIYCDPPYNIGLDYNSGISTQRKYKGDNFPSLKYIGFKDNKKIEEYKEFLDKTIKNAKTIIAENCHIFYWCDENYIWLLQNLFQENNIKNKRVCLWIKNNFNMTPQTAFNKVYEPCVYGIIGQPFLNKKYKNLNEVINKEVGTGNQTIDDILDIINIWLIKRDNAQDYEHPTQKPITLAQKPITRCTNLNDNILDLFGGSGSTLIAAEMLQRKAYLAEYEPIFCDLIIKRYECLTGFKAIKI